MGEHLSTCTQLRTSRQGAARSAARRAGRLHPELAQARVEREDAPGVLVEVLLLDDPPPTSAHEQECAVGVDLHAVGAGRAVVEADRDAQRPWRPRDPDLAYLAANAGAGEVAQEALDLGLAAVLARPAV